MGRAAHGPPGLKALEFYTIFNAALKGRSSTTFFFAPKREERRREYLVLTHTLQALRPVQQFGRYTQAEDVLKFSTGNVHVRETLKYSYCQRYGAKTRIIYNGSKY